MYRVIKSFVDLNDNDYLYKEDDVFPREGLKVTEARCAELAGKANKIGQPVIERLPDTKKRETPKPEVKKKEA